MSLTHSFLKITRTAHLYLGVFTAPMLLFFAITGGLQSFGLHESARGSSYAPPAWLATAAQFHKKQTTQMPVRRQQAPGAAAAGLRPDMVGGSIRSPERSAAPAPAGPPKKNLVPMKAFFALVASSLVLSVVSGLYMAWRYSRKPGLFGTILLAGVALPLLLMLF
jgi:uncharacterized iron-regulated membrane protein